MTTNIPADHEPIALSAFISHSPMISKLAAVYEDRIRAEVESLENEFMRDVFMMGVSAGLSRKDSPE